MHNRALLLCASLVLLMLASCARQGVRPSSAQSRLYEAQLLDVSIPVGAQVEPVSEGVLKYQTALTFAQLTEFYHIDMERLGWQEALVSERPEELLLVYEKPVGRCILVARPRKNQLDVTLYMK